MAIRGSILAGETVILDPKSGDARNVNAAWIREALLDGKPVDISNAVIVEPLEFRFGTISEDFSLADCTVKGWVDFSHSDFKKHLTIRDVHFERGIRFRGGRFRHDVKFISCYRYGILPRQKHRRARTR